MGCNCGKKRKPRPAPKPSDKKSGEKQSFVLMTQEGRQLTYGSKLEAEAANQRAGGTGTIKLR